MWGFLMLVVATSLLGQQQARPVVQLVVPGGVARATAGGGWIGLVANRDGFGWEKVRVEVKANRVSVQGAEPLFLLRGLPLLASKAVHTCFDRSETGSLQEQNPILLTCEAKAYRVEMKGEVPGLLQFRQGERVQTLYRFAKGWREQRVELVWAGDLDGDDKLDLVVDHEGMTLYLSSWAAAGQLVGRVATGRM